MKRYVPCKKQGDNGILPEEVDKMVDIAIEKTKELRKLLPK